MDDLTRTILGEAAAFGLLSLALALSVFAYIRWRSPEIRWHAHGNVYSQPYNALDMVVAGLIIFLFLSVLIFEVPSDSGATGLESSAPERVENGGTVKDATEVRPIQFAYMALYQLILIGSLFVYLTTGRGFNLSEIFGLRQMSVLKAFGLAAVLFVPIFLTVLFSGHLLKPILDRSLPDAEPQELVKTFVETRDHLLRWSITFSAVVMAPLFEEIIFRGFLYPVIKRHTERFFAAVFTGLIFAIIHYNIPATAPLWIFGILLALAYELTGSLWVPVFLHAIFNGLQTAGMFYAES